MFQGNPSRAPLLLAAGFSAGLLALGTMAFTDVGAQKRTDRLPQMATLGEWTLAQAAPTAPPARPMGDAASARGPAPEAPRPPMGGPDGRRRPGPPPPPSPMALAQQLSASETLIGIRADQFDAWRAYTDAALALAAPPLPPKREKDAEEQAAPFGHQLAMATALAGDAKKAEALVAAIAQLKGTLTAQQLERVAWLDTLPPPPPPGPPPARGPQMGGADGPGPR